MNLFFASGLTKQCFIPWILTSKKIFYYVSIDDFLKKLLLVIFFLNFESLTGVSASMFGFACLLFKCLLEYTMPSLSMKFYKIVDELHMPSLNTEISVNHKRLTSSWWWWLLCNWNTYIIQKSIKIIVSRINN